MFNAKEDSLKLKLLATGLTPKIVNVMGTLRRSARQKQKEAQLEGQVRKRESIGR